MKSCFALIQHSEKRNSNLSRRRKFVIQQNANKLFHCAMQNAIYAKYNKYHNATTEF